MRDPSTQRDDVSLVVLLLSQAHHRRHTVVGVHLQPPDEVVTHRHCFGDVLDVSMGIDEARHHRLPSQVHGGRPGRHLHPGSGHRDAALADEDGTVLDRRLGGWAGEATSGAG